MNKCQECNKIISKKATFCRQCFQKGSRNHRYTGKNTCIDCGKLLGRPEYIRCLDCRRIYVRTNPKKAPAYKDGRCLNNFCLDCGKKLKHPKNKYCMRCSKQRERNPAWRGGVTNISELIRKSDKYLFWRRKILIRDSYCCTECGNSNNLEVHHKISLRKIIKRFKLKTLDEAYSCKFLWNLFNGITLCDSCHILIDKQRKRFVGVK